MNRMKRSLVFGAAIIGLSLASSGGWAKETKVKIQDVPAPVRTVLEQKAQGGRIVDVGLVEESDGKKHYEAEIRAGGREFDVLVSPDGTLMNTRDEGPAKKVKTTTMSLEKAPAEVKAGLKKTLKEGAVVTQLRKKTERGATVFEARYELGGVKHSVKLAPDGTVLEQEKAIEPSALPEKVRAAVSKAHPKAKVVGAGEVVTNLYEVQITDENGKKQTVKVYASGGVVKTHKPEPKKAKE